MLMPLLLALLLTGEWAPGSDPAFATGCKDNKLKKKWDMQELVMVQEGLCFLLPLHSPMAPLPELPPSMATGSRRGLI
jgi:hypothetical protein